MHTEQSSRGNSPSASAWEANMLCPGRHRAQCGLPEGPQNPDAEAGQAIHAAWCDHPTRPLTLDEQDTLDVLRTKEMDILERWTHAGCLTEGSVGEWREIREMRLWHSWSARLQTGPIELSCSGQADVIYLDPPRALILDGKTGRKVVTAEPGNLQLRTLAALLAVNGRQLCGQQIQEVTVALVQHWSASNPPCVYGIRALHRASLEMMANMEAWYAPTARRSPHPTACEYCRAILVCPESRAIPDEIIRTASRS